MLFFNCTNHQQQQQHRHACEGQAEKEKKKKKKKSDVSYLNFLRAKVAVKLMSFYGLD